jgi:D-alanine-D-alanine ligase-like ATP-grasp enzyme
MPNYPPADEVEFGYYDYASQLLALEVMRRGLPVEWLTRAYFVTTYDGTPVGFWCTRTNLTSSVAARSTTRKDVTRMLLSRAGLSVAEGRGFGVERRDQALAYGEKLGFPLVMKPSNGGKGRGVTTGISSRAEMEAAWEAASANTQSVMVERYFTGSDAGRFLVVRDRCVAVAQKRPPVLTGDGTSTVEQLIGERNAERVKHAHLRNRLMVIDDTLVAELKRKELTLSSVVPAGERVVLDQTSNTSRGAETADITDDIHPSFAEVASRATAAIPGLGLAGVDILADDLTKPASAGNHIIVEINSYPGIRSHHYPDIGTPRDVAKIIVDETLETVVPTPDGSGSRTAHSPGGSLLRRVRKRTGAILR